MKFQSGLCFTFLGVLISFYTFSQKVSKSYPARLKDRPAIYCMDSDADGNLILGGNFQFHENEQIGSIVKINSAGLMAGEVYEANAKDGTVGVVKALPDGKVLALLNAFESVSKIVRYNTNGTLDTSFPEISDLYISDFKLQSDGKILVVGAFDNFDETGYAAIVRFSANGEFDSTFPKAPVSYSSTVRKIAIDKDDNIFYGDRNRVVKIAKDGSVHPDFILGDFKMTYPYQLVIDQEGKLIVNGQYIVSLTPYTAEYRGYRINTDGSIDNSFNSAMLANQVTDLVVRPNGNILVCGYFVIDNDGVFTGYNLLELNPNGTLKKTYDIHTLNRLSLFQNNSGQAYALGDISLGSVAKSILKISDNGLTDIPMPIYSLNYSVLSAVQSDGKLVVSANSPTFRVDELNNNIVRIDSDGTADATFQPFISNDFLSLLTAQQDGKLLGFTGNARFIRMLENGAADQTFATGSGFRYLFPGGGIGYAAIQSMKERNSKIFVSGIFNDYKSETVNNVAVLDLDGNKVGPEKKLNFASFNLREMVVRSDEKMILWGDFKFDGSNQQYSIIQLNSDGSLDKGLLIAPNPYSIFDIEVDEQDRLLIAGQFSNFLGSAYSGLVRLNVDGSVDNTFKITSTYFYNYSGVIKCLTNDKIAIAGIANYKDQPVPGFAVIDNNSNLISLENNIDLTSRIIDLAYGNNTLYVIGKIVTDNGNKISGAAKIVFPIENPEISDFSVEAKSDSSAVLSWSTEMIGAEKFVISQSLTGLNYVPIDTVSVAIKTYTANNLEELTTYYFSVYGVNEQGSTDPSNANGTTFITVPKALSATQVTASSFVTNWKSIDKTQNYVLQVSADNFETFVSGNENRETTETSALVTDLKPGIYKFRVKRKREDIFSDFSTPIEVSTLMMVGVEGDKNSKTVFYPNPVRDKVVVHAGAGTRFEILGLNGTVIKANESSQNESAVIDLSNLASGLYMLRVTSKTGTNIYKLIKEQ
jgi:uncharacterized delta-60 repeat protein